MQSELIQSLQLLSQEKGVSVERLKYAVEEGIVKSYRSQNKNAVAELDLETGKITVQLQYIVTDEVIDENTQISLKAAKRISEAYEIDDIVSVPADLKEYGRIAAQTFKGVMRAKIQDFTKENVMNEFEGRECNLVEGIIHGEDSRENTIVKLGNIDAILTKKEKNPNEVYISGKRFKFVITKIRYETKGVEIYISRNDPELVKRIFEINIPEIEDGVVEIVSVSREAGSRTKILVKSNDPNVDAIGACIGTKRIRIDSIVDELAGEKIDLIEWDENPAMLISNALNPAKVEMVEFYIDEKYAIVVVPDDQLSLAIGKEGQNVRLAAKLIGWKIDIKDNLQYKEYLKEIGDYDEVYGEDTGESLPEEGAIDHGEDE